MRRGRRCPSQREATRSLSPNAKIARRVSFSFHCEISKNSIIINSGQGGGGGAGEVENGK